jgi:hypothetical protein
MLRKRKKAARVQAIGAKRQTSGGPSINFPAGKSKILFDKQSCFRARLRSSTVYASGRQKPSTNKLPHPSNQP